jgi:hypothetical protein
MFEGFEFSTALLIFIGYFFLDIASSWVIIAIQKLQRGIATTLTFFLYIGSAAGIIEYTNNFIYAFPVALGATLGTWVLLTIEKHRQKKNNLK